MLRSPSSSVSSPACALSPPEGPSEGPSRKNEGFGKAYQHYLADQGSARSLYLGQRPRNQNEQSQPDYHANNDWRSGSYDSSNTSWESDWSASRGGTIKSESPNTTAFYKYRNNTGSYQSGTDWSGDPPVYGVMQHSQQSSSNSPSASSSSYYDSNDYYGYSSYDQNTRGVPPGYQQQQQQQQYGSMSQQPYHTGAMSGSYNGSRNPSSCPPTPSKQQEYFRRQTRYGAENVIRTQIKREPDPDGSEMEGDNFTSLFTKSLTSLYSQDTENAYGDDSKTYDSDIMICTPSGSVTHFEDNSYQRLGPPPPGQYNPGYPNMRNNFGFYENRPQNNEASVVQELGSGPERSSAFRYDRPSFDDMHLYASNPPETKSQAKKRKLSMPNIGPESGNYSGGDSRRKVTRGMAFKSEAKWTPNSFAFSDVQIKQEPLDDYTTEDLDSQNRNIMQYKDNSVGNGSSGKIPCQQSDHVKAPPRKRSPASTCFDRFEKKSTPQSKKVSPLSVYAKVQECVVLNVKCRRYKKRTKPGNVKEEAVYPGKEEIENWKRIGAYSESPDEAIRHLMRDMLEKVSHVGIRAPVDTSGPDLSQLDIMKVRELLYQFCQRYSLDYRDFEDIDSILRPNIIKDKTAKNSIRASAIRKRTSVSPPRPKQAPEPETKPPRTEKVAKKLNSDAPRPAERRILRSLPGRVDRSRQPRRRTVKSPVVRRRYSTRSAKDVEETNHSDVDIIIDSSTDRESEAGKEAEVRKKSQRLKNKQPVEMPAKENSKPPTKILRNTVRKDEPRTRSREKREAEKLKDISKAAPKKKWSRLHITNSENSMSSSGDSVEIIGSSNCPSKPIGKESKIAIKIEPLSSLKSSTATKTSERISNRNSKHSEESQDRNSKISEDSNNNSLKQIENTTGKNWKNSQETSNRNSRIKEQSTKNVKTEDSSSSKMLSRRSEKIISQIKTKKVHLMGRRRKPPQIEKEPIIVDEDSSLSKDDYESSSRTNQKASEKTPIKESDTSSDESKDSSSEPEDHVSDKKTISKQSSSASVDKETEQTNKEFDVPKNSSKVANDLDKNESVSSDISFKSDSVDKCKDETNNQEQNLEKPLKFRLFSDRNESTLQIKLSRLPLKLDSKKRLLPMESQNFFCSEDKAKLDTEPNLQCEDKEAKVSDLQDPPELVCMKEPEKEKKDDAEHKEESCTPILSSENEEIPPANLVAITEPIANAKESIQPMQENEVLGKPCPIIRPRYSESEDSDCGLVIDLDRRLSIEERVPSPTFQNYTEKKKEAKDLDLSDMTLDLVVKKEPAVTPPSDGLNSPANNCIDNKNEDDCILLSPSEDSLRLDSRSVSFLENTAKSFSLVDSELEHAKKLKDQDESILRTLLLETADVANGVSQDLHCDAAADISADSKASISKDVMKLLMYQTYHEVSPLCSSPGFDDKKIPIDQLTADVNAQLLNDEEFSRDPRMLKEQIKKLRNELVYLQCMIDQKDKERTAIICFKRYKEEVLKRVMKQYAATIQLRDWIRSRQGSSSSERSSSERNSSGKQVPVASTSSTQPSLPSDSPHPQLSPSHQVIQLAYHATVKTDVPTSTVTSASSKKSSSPCSESLPTVATMIAKATENYGVDMRTMRNSSSTTQTILQKVLSSKESIYSPTACRSPSSDKSSSSKSTTHHQQQSVQIFQKTLSSTREACFSPAHCRSPSLPELRPGLPKSTTPSHPQLLHKALSSKDSSPTSSRSPPSLQPELRPTKTTSTLQSSSSQRISSKSSDCHPLDLIVNTADKLKMSSSKSYDSIPTYNSKNSPETNVKHSSSPKHSSSTSYSAWSSIHSRTSLSATTTTTIDLRTDHTRKTQESLPLSKRPLNGSHSSSGQGFMVVPPPTTLQQSQKANVVHQSRSDNSHPIEKSLKSNMEKMYCRKAEEDRRSMSFSSSVLSVGNSLQYSNPHKTMPPATTSNSNSVGSNKAIVPPPQTPQTSAPRCMGCGLSHAKFLCSGCRSHWYCSHECQSMRWPEHSRTCVGNIGVYNQSPGTSYS